MAVHVQHDITSWRSFEATTSIARHSWRDTWRRTIDLNCTTRCQLNQWPLICITSRRRCWNTNATRLTCSGLPMNYDVWSVNVSIHGHTTTLLKRRRIAVNSLSRQCESFFTSKLDGAIRCGATKCNYTLLLVYTYYLFSLFSSSIPSRKLIAISSWSF